MNGLPSKRTLVLSPHLDDAALSCGGLMHEIRRRGGAVMVATAFAAVPNSECSDGSMIALSLKGSARTWVRARRAEDLRALRALGVKATHGAELDAAFRKGPMGEPLYPTWSAIFSGAAHPADRDLLQRLTAWILRCQGAFGATAIVAPRGLGNHIDHLILREAAQVACRRQPIFLHLYDDVPYAAVSRPRPRAQLSRQKLAPVDLAIKQRCVRLYRCSLAIGVRPETIISQMAKQGRALRGHGGRSTERYWFGRRGTQSDSQS